MLLKSRLLIAAAMVLGATSIAAAQADADNMMDYQRVSTTAPVQGASAARPSPYAFDEDAMLFHGPVGGAAFAQAPAITAAVAAAARQGCTYDEDNMYCYEGGMLTSSPLDGGGD